MDPPLSFCPHFSCLKRGLAGQGNIAVHSPRGRRFRCTCCGKTFAASRNTPSYRRHKPTELMTVVLPLLTHGCPLQALVAAYGLDERTAAAWQDKAGRHARRFPQLPVEQGQVDARQVQADERGGKRVARKLCLARAPAVPSRLWLGGLGSPRRDGRLLAALAGRVKACLRTLAVLVRVAGLAGYVKAFVRAFRHKVQGRIGRPRRVVEPGLPIGQLIKRYRGRRVVEVVRRVARGTAAAVSAVLARTGTGTGINTAYSERLHATFRASRAPRVRRGRALRHEGDRLRAATYLVGCAYNGCWEHDSLRVAAPQGAERKGSERTPAMAAGRTDHRWGLDELLQTPVTPEARKAPRVRRRRRPPKAPAAARAA